MPNVCDKRLEEALPKQVAEIHSNKAQHTRLAAMAQFRAGDVRVLVSTDVSARGIDVPETEVVINFNVPRMSDDYVHCIGRTGRADRSGMAYTLVDPTDEVALSRVLERLPVDGRPEDLELSMQVERQRHLQVKRKPWPAPSISKNARPTPPTRVPSTKRRKRKVEVGAQGASVANGDDPVIFPRHHTAFVQQIPFVVTHDDELPVPGGGQVRVIIKVKATSDQPIGGLLLATWVLPRR